MNTKQKLTLGIAAIFMVTLTIVGVTYAYFVTQVTGNDSPSTVNVQTAKFASVEYGDGNNLIDMTNVMPGTTKYKTFSVTNKGQEGVDAALAYNVILESKPTGDTEFIHGKDDTEGGKTVAAQCYNKETYEDTAVCYAGTAYDNIYITIYKTSTADVTTGLDSLTPVVSERKLSYFAAKDGNYEGAQLFDELTQVNILAGEANTHYYTLKVEYRSTDSNQNLEATAGVDIRVNIK